MGYLFSIIAFLILTPIILKINLGIKSSTKMMILTVALLLSILGVFAVPLLGFIKTLLILFLLTLILAYMLGNRLTDREDNILAIEDGEGLSRKSKPRMIIIQEQPFHRKEALQELKSVNVDEKIELDEENTLLDQKDTLVEEHEAKETNVETNWVNEVEEELTNQNQVDDTTFDIKQELIVNQQDEKDETFSWLNEISEMQKADDKEPVKKPIPSGKVTHDLEEIHEFTNLKDVKPTNEKADNKVDELDTLAELLFEPTNDRKN